MQKMIDESNRISRLNSLEAQKYLAEIKGEKYMQYRLDWSHYGRSQIIPTRPLQLNIELTADCNLRCQMCHRSYDIKTRGGRLTLEEIRILAEQYKQLEIPSIWMSGGEPLTHPNINEILRVFGRTNPLDFWLVTNGILLSNEVVETLFDGGLTWLSVSLDAVSPETYKKIRGGDLDCVHQKIENFLNARSCRKSKTPFLRVTFVRMADNEMEIEEFLRKWQNKADIIDIQTLADYHGLSDIDDEDVATATYQCTAPFTLLSVLPNGDFLPCCNSFYGEKSDFNIHNASISDYWNSNERTEFAISVKNKKYSKECIKCVKSFLPR